MKKGQKRLAVPPFIQQSTFAFVLCSEMFFYMKSLFATILILLKYLPFRCADFVFNVCSLSVIIDMA